MCVGSLKNGFCSVPSIVRVPAGGSLRVTFVSVIRCSLETSGDPRAIAESIFAELQDISADALYAIHTTSWQELWYSGNIAIEGDLELAQAVQGSLFYIMASVRDDWPYGISPGGLASDAYNGHVFWDSETWMYPSLVLLQPPLARSLLSVCCVCLFRSCPILTYFATVSPQSPVRSTGESICRGISGRHVSLGECIHRN
jgi:hypothetical protein